MGNQTSTWQPNRDEVNAIVAELRPLIRQLAYRDQQSIARDVLRRRAARDEREAADADAVAAGDDGGDSGSTDFDDPDAPGNHDHP